MWGRITKYRLRIGFRTTYESGLGHIWKKLDLCCGILVIHWQKKGKVSYLGHFCLHHERSYNWGYIRTSATFEIMNVLLLCLASTLLQVLWPSKRNVSFAADSFSLWRLGLHGVVYKQNQKSLRNNDAAHICSLIIFSGSRCSLPWIIKLISLPPTFVPIYI